MLGKFAEDRRLGRIESVPENRMRRLNELDGSKKGSVGVNVTTHSKIFIYQLALNCWLRVVLGEDKFPGISDPILIGRAALCGLGGRYSGKNS